MAKLQVQQPSGEWKTFASCNDKQASIRLAIEAKKHKGRRVRAVTNDEKTLLDLL